MRTLVNQPVSVHYWQFYVTSGDGFPDLAEAFAGQRNGLCGAAVPGHLFLNTGLHSGEVGLTVELHEEPPPLAEGWPDVVEVSFRPLAGASVEGWGGDWSFPLGLTEGSYRVRYCAFGLDEGRAEDTRLDFDPNVEWYLLQFWPAPPQPDQVIRQTSETAASSHQFARRQPPPPTAQEKEAAERRAARERAEQAAQEQRQAAQARLRDEERAWGGRLPGERLRQLGGFALRVAQLDRPLADALGDADPVTQREIARWVTRRAFAEAGLADIDWIAPALAAMDRGNPLPPPFDGDGGPRDRRAADRLRADPRVPRTVVTSPDGRFANCRQQAFAFPAISSARQDDPLRAALDALWHGAAGFGRDRYQVLFAEVRQAFPALAAGG